MSAATDSATARQTLSSDVMAVVRAARVAQQPALFRAVVDLVDRVRAMLASRRAEAELKSLDDRLLADIGITRGDIPAVLANTNDRPTRVA